MQLSSFASMRRTPALGLGFVVAIATGVAAAGTSGCGVRTPLGEELGGAGLAKGNEGAADAGVPDVGPTSVGASPDAGAAGDAGGEDASAEDANLDDDGALPATDLGDVLFTSGVYGNGAMPTLAATAVFYPSVSATGCAVTEVAGCMLEVCTALNNSELVGAGTIAMSGGAYPVVLEETSPGQYGLPVYGDGGVLAAWHGGEQLFVSGAGETVPAFSASLTAPTQVTVTTPVPGMIARSTPFTLAWFQASAGRLEIALKVAGGSTQSYLSCGFDVASGTGVVPAEALGALPAGNAGIAVQTVVERTVAAGPWEVRVFAQADAQDATGAEWRGSVGLE